MNASEDEPKVLVGDFLDEQIILSVEGALIESAQLVEPCFRKQHEHAGAERPAQQGTVLHKVAAEVEKIIGQVAAAAPDVGGNAVQLTPLCQVDGPPNQSGVFQFQVGINKKNKRRSGLASACIATDGRQSTRNDFHIETSAEAQCQLGCAVGGTGVSNEDFGMPHLRIVLPGQRFQQIRQ